MINKRLISIALLLTTTAGQAATPQQILGAYTAEATAQQADFVPSAQRGATFYQKHFGVSNVLPSCATCHAENPTSAGRHQVTGKTINPLAPRANSVRLTDPQKVEKWLRRNCREVVGRECFAREKADFIQFLLQ